MPWLPNDGNWSSHSQSASIICLVNNRVLNSWCIVTLTVLQCSFVRHRLIARPSRLLGRYDNDTTRVDLS